MREGAYPELGLVAFGAAMELPVGEWSEVLEEIGCFTSIRVLERREGAVPEATTFVLDVLEACFVDEGVERTFPIHSPKVQGISVVRRGAVRRAKLFYLRDRVGKATRIKEKLDIRRKKKD